MSVSFQAGSYKDGFPLSEARGKDGPFIPCYASLPLEVPKAGGNKEDKTSLYGVVRGVHPCVALRRACTRLICFLTDVVET